MAVRMVARAFGFVCEPAVRPDLGGAQHLPTRAHDNTDRLVVVQNKWQAGHQEPLPVIGRYVVSATTLPGAPSYNVASYNELTGWRGTEWLFRHVQRRVQLTLRLRRREPGARLGTAAPDDLPAAILTLQRLRGERDHLTYRGTGEDHVHPPGPGAQLQLGEQRMPVACTRGSEGRGIDDHQAGRYVGEPAAERDDERLEPAGELLSDRPALRAFDRPEVVIHEKHLGVVRRDEEGRRERRGADYDSQVAGLESAHRAHERAVRFEAPMGRGALRGAQGAVLLAPAREGRQAQPPGDDAVDVLEQQHLGEEVLSRRALLELAHRLVADLQQILSRERIL